jgi:hypothetical protein
LAQQGIVGLHGGQGLLQTVPQLRQPGFGLVVQQVVQASHDFGEALIHVQPGQAERRSGLERQKIAYPSEQVLHDGFAGLAWGGDRRTGRRQW